jgi:hypothetical protein
MRDKLRMKIVSSIERTQTSAESVTCQVSLLVSDSGNI